MLISPLVRNTSVDMLHKSVPRLIEGDTLITVSTPLNHCASSYPTIRATSASMPSPVAPEQPINVPCAVPVLSGIGRPPSPAALPSELVVCCQRLVASTLSTDKSKSAVAPTVQAKLPETVAVLVSSSHTFVAVGVKVNVPVSLASVRAPSPETRIITVAVRSAELYAVG